MGSMTEKIESITEKWMSAPKNVYRSFNIWWVFTGCFSLYGFVFLKLPSIAASGFFHALMMLAFFVSIYKAPRSAKRDPAWYFIIAAIAISLFIYLWSNAIFPEYGEHHPSTGKLLSLCLFFPVAWWLGGDARNVLNLLMFAVIGFFVDLLLNGSWTDFAAGIAEKRVDFNMQNAQHAAIFFSVSFIGWLLFVRRVIGTEVGRLKGIRILIWIFGIFFLGAGCIVTQTRSAWYGVAVALLFVAFIVLLNRKYALRQMFVGFATIVIVLAALLYPMSNMVSNRLSQETDVMHQLLAGDIENMPYSSIGIRVHTWVEAWKWIRQRPITGWGGNIKADVFAESDTLPTWVVERFGHFHNSYIEILLSYGIIGILFVTALFYFIARHTWLAWRAGLMPSDIFLFGVAFLIFWLLVNMTESYLMGRTGVYLMGLVGGSLYTFSLSERQKLQADKCNVGVVTS